MTRSLLAALCAASLAAGCGGSSRPLTPTEGQEVTLAQVGELYRNYQMTKKAPPQKPEDFVPLRQVAGAGLDAVLSKAVIVRYGATLPDDKEEPGQSPSDEVLAYYADVPQSGGKVLLLNRTVKTMTADEFKAAKLAGKEGPAPRAAKKAS